MLSKDLISYKKHIYVLFLVYSSVGTTSSSFNRNNIEKYQIWNTSSSARINPNSGDRFNIALRWTHGTYAVQPDRVYAINENNEYIKLSYELPGRPNQLYIRGTHLLALPSGNYKGFRFELDGTYQMFYCEIRDWLTFTI